MGKPERTLAATPETAAPVTEEVMNEEVFNVSTAPVPTTGDFEKATHRVNSDVTVRDIRRKSLGVQYAAEKKFTVMIAPMYEAYFDYLILGAPIVIVLIGALALSKVLKSAS